MFMNYKDKYIMQVPTHLKHNPVITVENYSKIDGRHANKTDAKGLSLGLAQWNEKGLVDISAKIWRHTDEKWSRQSEEMPLHRVLDLALLICTAKKYVQDSYQHSSNRPKFEQIALQGAAMNITMCDENPTLQQDLELFITAFQKDDELISERLQRLSSLLKDLGY